MIRQLGEQIPADAVIVETSNNTDDFYSVAAQAPDHFAVFLVNTSEETLTINVEGLPEGSYTHIQTTEGELKTTIGVYAIPNDAVSIQIPGMSIHVLTTRYSNNPR